MAGYARFREKTLQHRFGHALAMFDTRRARPPHSTKIEAIDGPEARNGGDRWSLSRRVRTLNLSVVGQHLAFGLLISSNSLNWPR